MNSLPHFIVEIISRVLFFSENKYKDIYVLVCFIVAFV